MSRIDTELLAPAGSMAALNAALESGADAVYFGLQSLNARQGAENFRLEDLNEIVELIHSHNARAFLTLNIDLTARDIGKAARILTAAENAGVNAILFTDPAILMLKPEFPELEFHFSTQASITTSEGIKSARDLGVTRVVVAREMSAAEIKAACKISNVEIEVFTQGALCMCISGRCLLSSWGGGKSGNRGACTSPCRVTWKINNDDKEDILSTQDLSLIEKLPELITAGVTCLKIEGRLKNASWVAKAVTLYRNVLDGKASYTKDDTLPLGAYTGRSMTDGYYTGQRHTIFGSGGRIASRNADIGTDNTTTATTATAPALSSSQTTPDFPDYFNLTIFSENTTIECKLEYNSETINWTLPKTVIKHENRGITVRDAGNWLSKLKIQQSTLNEFITDNPEFLISKKAANKIADRISASIHRIKKQDIKNPATEITLSDTVRELTKFKTRNTNNRFTPVDRPNALRINIIQAEDILKKIHPERIIVEEATPEDITKLKELTAGSELVVALPPVFFENEVTEVKELCSACKEHNIMVEVNGWDSWQIAKDLKLKFSGGPGMAVLNPLAAEALQNLGFESVSFSLEAGEKQLIDLARSCTAEAMLTVFSRPVLAHTRANFADRLNEDTVLRDARGISLSVHFHKDITELRSTKPFSIGGIDSPEIKARWICADLIDSPNPLREWKNIHKAKNKEMFNFEKGLF